jgi:hypothetical protein
MADTNTNPVTSLYPAPPSAPPQPLVNSMNPLQVLGAVDAARRLQANQAIGQAYQGALNPDGSIDQGKLSSALAGSPAAAYGLPEASSRMLEQQRGQFDLDSRRHAFLTDLVGAMADDPDLSQDKVRSYMVTAARNTKLPAAIFNGILERMPANRKDLRSWATDLRNQVIGSAGTSTPTEGGVGPAGEPIVTTRGTFNYRGGAVGLGQGEKGLSESAAGRAAELQATASSSPQMHADLENLRQDSAVMGNLGGPTQQVEKQLNQLSTRLAGFGITMSPDQLRASESFDKIASTIALRQGAALGGTDSARSMAVGSTPNSGMSRYGRDGVIDLLHGNQDAIDTAREAWIDARSKGAPAGSFDLFMHRFGKTLDPRVFQFNRLSRDNKQKFLDQIPPQDVGRFEQNYQAAVARGWVPPLSASNGK